MNDFLTIKYRLEFMNCVKMSLFQVYIDIIIVLVLKHVCRYMSPDLATWVWSRTLTNNARALKSQNDLDLIYFQFSHKFLFSYNYFRILKLCGIEIDEHVVIFCFKYICYFNFSPNYIPIFVSIYMLPWKQSLWSRKYWYSVKTQTMKISTTDF